MVNADDLFEIDVNFLIDIICLSNLLHLVCTYLWVFIYNKYIESVVNLTFMKFIKIIKMNKIYFN